jgi:hypothetical protein
MTSYLVVLFLLAFSFESSTEVGRSDAVYIKLPSYTFVIEGCAHSLFLASDFPARPKTNHIARHHR